MADTANTIELTTTAAYCGSPYRCGGEAESNGTIWTKDRSRAEHSCWLSVRHPQKSEKRLSHMRTAAVAEGGGGSDRQSVEKLDDESWLRKFCYKGDPMSAVEFRLAPYAFSMNPADSLHQFLVGSEHGCRSSCWSRLCVPTTLAPCEYHSRFPVDVSQMNDGKYDSLRACLFWRLERLV